MKTAHSREILYFDLDVRASPIGAPVKSMVEFAGYVARLHAADRAVMWTRDQEKKLRLAAVEYVPEHSMLWLLLYASNRSGSDPAFSHMERDTHRIVTKEQDEGRAEASHLLISAIPDGDVQGRYIALFEASSSIPRARLERFLRNLFRFAKQEAPDDFMRPDPTGERKRDGTPKLAPYKNTINLLGHLSAILREQIETGTIHNIVLETARREHFGTGELPFATPVRKQLHLKVTGDAARRARNFVARTLRFGHEAHYERARIVFSAPDDEERHTTVLDTADGRLLTDGFVRSEEITFPNTRVPDAFDTFQTVIQNRMQSLLIDYRRNG